jgi:hypothetical protein
MNSLTNYAGRVSDLSNGGGLNGQYLLNANTVHSDGLSNSLLGNGGLDWFFSNPLDVNDWDSSIGEQLVSL